MQSAPQHRLSKKTRRIDLSDAWLVDDIPDLSGRVQLRAIKPVFDGQYSAVYCGILGDRMVAVKVLKEINGADAQTMRRKIRRERTVWGLLQHPNVLPLCGFADDHELFQPLGALISPWRARGNAFNFLEARGKDLSINQRLNLWKGVVTGVKYLHNHTPALVHGDLKSENILIDDHDIPQICDFGLVSIYHEEGWSEMNTTSPHTGTCRYMAYELLLDEETVAPTAASDIFALGCIGLEFHFLQIPYAHRKNNMRGQIFADIKARKPPAIRPTFSHPQDAVIWGLLVQCWAPEPSERINAQQILAFLKEPPRARTNQAISTLAVSKDQIHTSWFKDNSELKILVFPLPPVHPGPLPTIINGFIVQLPSKSRRARSKMPWRVPLLLFLSLDSRPGFVRLRHYGPASKMSLPGHHHRQAGQKDNHDHERDAITELFSHIFESCSHYERSNEDLRTYSRLKRSRLFFTTPRSSSMSTSIIAAEAAMDTLISYNEQRIFILGFEGLATIKSDGNPTSLTLASLGGLELPIQAIRVGLGPRSLTIYNRNIKLQLNMTDCSPRSSTTPHAPMSNSVTAGISGSSFLFVPLPKVSTGDGSTNGTIALSLDVVTGCLIMRSLPPSNSSLRILPASSPYSNDGVGYSSFSPSTCDPMQKTKSAQAVNIAGMLFFTVILMVMVLLV